MFVNLKKFYYYRNSQITKFFTLNPKNFIQIHLIFNTSWNLLLWQNKNSFELWNSLFFKKFHLYKTVKSIIKKSNNGMQITTKKNFKLGLSSFKGEILTIYKSFFDVNQNKNAYGFSNFSTSKNLKTPSTSSLLANSKTNFKTIENIWERKRKKKVLSNLKYPKKEFFQICYLTDQDIITYKIQKTPLKFFKIQLGSFLPYGTEMLSDLTVPQSGQVLFISKNKIILRKAKAFLLSSGGICNLEQGSFVNIHSPLLTLTYKNLKTEDIVQGIPKIEQLFEARENLKEQLSLNHLLKRKFQFYKKNYPKKESVRKSIEFIQQYIIKNIQKVYQSQNVNISDKHIEVIVKQMTSKVCITDVGNTGLLRGDIVYLDWIELINSGLENQKANYEPIVLGITKASLEMDGFISAASFQETIKILSRAAILQKRDFLRGLKENLILGHLLPAGTGFELFF